MRKLQDRKRMGTCSAAGDNLTSILSNNGAADCLCHRSNHSTLARFLHEGNQPKITGVGSRAQFQLNNSAGRLRLESTLKGFLVFWCLSSEVCRLASFILPS